MRLDLQFYGQHFEWTRDAPKRREVQRLRAELGVRSRVRRGKGQVRIWIWSVVWLFRLGHLERPLGKRAMWDTGPLRETRAKSDQFESEGIPIGVEF